MNCTKLFVYIVYIVSCTFLYCVYIEIEKNLSENSTIYNYI